MAMLADLLGRADPRTRFPTFSARSSRPSGAALRRAGQWLLAVFLAGFLAIGAMAQQLPAPGVPPSVRPPGHAGNVPMEAGPENTLGTLPDSDVWRMLREGGAGQTSAPRPDDRLLIEGRQPPWVDVRRPEIFTAPPPTGLAADFTRADWWARLRHAEQALPVWAGYVLGGVLLAILAFALIRGPLRVPGGFSGRKILRFRLYHRVVHWSIAAVFVIMAISGLLLLLGRPFLIPLLGKEAFSVIATAAMQAHNLFGPVFMVLLAALFVTFLPGNFPRAVDLVWLARGGGLFGGHAPAGRYNLGEKGWFWTAVLIGALLGGTGIVMLFPDDLGTRALLEVSVLSHDLGAIVVIAYAMGHIYLGTYGTEGAFEGMVSGCVDENWARSHHEQWLEELERKGQIEECEE